jgi:hypothetical protein
MPRAKQRKRGDRWRCSCGRRTDIAVLDNLGCTPAIAERELDAIEHYLGDAIAGIFEKSTGEESGPDRRPSIMHYRG